MQCDALFFAALCKEMHKTIFRIKVKEKTILWHQTSSLYADVNEALSTVFSIKRWKFFLLENFLLFLIE
jgi:hypothetical protein